MPFHDEVRVRRTGFAGKKRSASQEKWVLGRRIEGGGQTGALPWPRVGNREGGSVVVGRVDEWIVDEHVEVERGWGARWRRRDNRWDREGVEDLAGDAFVGDDTAAGKRMGGE